MDTTTSKKMNQALVTDIGRNLFSKLGSGKGEILYTKAALYTQDLSGMTDEQIRALTSLAGEKMTTGIKVADISPVDKETKQVDIEFAFSNHDLNEDINFKSIGLYATIDGGKEEILVAIIPAIGTATLGAGSPDHTSTQLIKLGVAFKLGAAAKINISVKQIGVVYDEDLDAAILKLKAEYDPKIEQAGKVKGAKINDGAVVEPDDDGILDLIVDSDRIKDLPAGLTDLNNLTESGMYRLDTLQNSVANRPPISPLFLQKGFLKVISDAKTKNVVQFFVTPMGSNFVWLRGRRGDGSAWSNWNRASSTSYSNDDIKNLINSKVDGLNVGQFIKKVNGLTPDGSGNVNVTSTVARGFDANANVATKETVENLHGGNQILLDQNAGQDIVNWTKGQLNGKLSTSGGDMDEHSTINWNGAGDVNSHDGNIGGLTWSGATDNVRLFADNDANDNLDLVIQLGDDNSNAVVIRNSTGAQVARVDASGNISSPTINDLQRQINDLKEDNVNKQKQINDLINNVTYIKDNYVEGRRFPASQEAQAQAWENEKPTRLAMIEK
ncbi:pyocin knob domain-containing protein [Lactobacillus crispatus]|uniref:pyocin knob domain-containing protein n=1 Tax=Lactobacillus crispatus TaxID=47770 RepID=UPI00105C10AC|nr:pyocin knob domain-containing protein [Lactobacillus crispatus]MCZ9645504.1 pyocin knob domain-containing protein [Lactobacillus crispatus]MCZ9650957.1 pyocin knob domain-containing protein [Lactobacillus crispatus]TDM81901.1 hypothetical protein CEE95_14605 [Lactobacillus crispatus]TDM96233.1 hypothetical protein CEE89_05645 [Lactobacillus crispatus]TDN33850.1 hypothetical protein CEE74_05240 [Lactobacillus crispatus]